MKKYAIAAAAYLLFSGGAIVCNLGALWLIFHGGENFLLAPCLALLLACAPLAGFPALTVRLCRWMKKGQPAWRWFHSALLAGAGLLAAIAPYLIF